jgi:hypothetical protein
MPERNSVCGVVFASWMEVVGLMTVSVMAVSYSPYACDRSLALRGKTKA